MARKPTDEVQLKLRFSEALRRRLERVAAANNRSMNAEIIDRLEWSLKSGTAVPEVFKGLIAARAVNEAVNEKLDRIIARLEAKEPERAKESSSIQGPSWIRPDGEKK